MPVIDYKALLDAQAWTLLEAHADFATYFLPGNERKDDGAAQIRKAAQRAPADFGSIEVQLTDGQPLAANAPRTFGMNSTSLSSATIDYAVPCTCRGVITMTFDMRMTKARRFAAESVVRQVLNAARPKFGYSWVSDFTVTETRPTQRAQRGQPERIVIVQTLNFNLMPKRSQLGG